MKEYKIGRWLRIVEKTSDKYNTFILLHWASHLGEALDMEMEQAMIWNNVYTFHTSSQGVSDIHHSQHRDHIAQFLRSASPFRLLTLMYWIDSWLAQLCWQKFLVLRQLYHQTVLFLGKGVFLWQNSTRLTAPIWGMPYYPSAYKESDPKINLTLVTTPPGWHVYNQNKYTI